MRTPDGDLHPAWRTIYEIATATGHTEWEISGLIKTGRLPAYRIGRTIKARTIDLADLGLHPPDMAEPPEPHRRSDTDPSTTPLSINAAATYLGVSWSVANRLITAGNIPNPPTVDALDRYLDRVLIDPDTYRQRSAPG